MTTRHDLVRRFGQALPGPMRVDITPHNAGWGWSGLARRRAGGGGVGQHRVAGQRAARPAAGRRGARDLRQAGGRAHGPRERVRRGHGLRLRRTRPRGADHQRGRAVGSPCPPRGRRVDLPFRYVPASDVSVETARGRARARRQVNNFCTPDTFEADRLIACEVLTPGGNWSSYPPHKHDEEREGETALEEIYYFEVADGPTGPGMAYQRVYGTDDRPIDVLGRGALRRRRADPARLARPVHRRTRLRPVLPQRHGRTRARSGPGASATTLRTPGSRQTWDGQPVDPRLPLSRAR